MSKTFKRTSILVALVAFICSIVGFLCVNTAFASDEYAGASITVRSTADFRIADDGHNGIRFTAELTGFNEGNFSIDDFAFYMAIVPADFLNHDAFASTEGDAVTKLEATISAINADKGSNMTLNKGWCTPVEQAEGTWIIRYSITNVLYDNSNRDFVAVAWANDSLFELEKVVVSEISASQNLTALAAKGLASGSFEEGGAYADSKSIVEGFIDNGFKKAVGISKEEAPNVARPVLTAQIPETVTVNAGTTVNYGVTITDENGTEAVGLDDLIVMNKTEDAYPDAYIAYAKGQIEVNPILITNTWEREFSSIADLIAIDSTTSTLKIVNEDSNIFGEAYLKTSGNDDGTGGWMLIHPKSVDREYDATEGAMKATLGENAQSDKDGDGVFESAGINSRGMVLYVTNAELKYQLEQGNNTLSFQVKGTANAIRIYSRLSHVTGQDYNQDVGAIQDGTTGVKVYTDVNITSAYQTVTVDLTKFLALQDAKYFAIVFQGNVGSHVYLKDATFSYQETSYDVNNIFGELYSWSTNAANTHKLSKTATTITDTISGDGAKALTERYQTIYLPATKLIEEYYENGNNTLTFDVEATASTGIRVFALSTGLTATVAKGAVKEGTDGLTVATTVENITTKQTVSVDLETFFNDYGKDVKYLEIVVYAADGTAVTFSNSAFSYEVNYNLFGSVNTWTAIGQYAQVKLQTTNELLLRLTLGSGCNDLAYRYTSSITSAEKLKELYAKGYETLTFKARAYKFDGENEVDADSTIPTQIRVFTKETGAFVDGVRIEPETAGIGNCIDITLTREYQEYTIDLTALFGDEELGTTKANYIGINLASDGGCCFALKDAQLKKK